MADLNSIGGIHYEMMRRCYNEKSIMYRNYGAVGIKVCEEWKNRENFKVWAINNGYIKGLGLQRKDTTKDYTPDNCYFSSKYKKITNGKNQKIKQNIKKNKAKKKEIGLKRLGDSRLPHILSNMIYRCHNPKSPLYENYGAKGVVVCDEWQGKDGVYNFIKWALENGWQELEDYKLQTVDRIDPNGNYEPSNCRFLSLSEQQQNKRKR